MRLFFRTHQTPTLFSAALLQFFRRFVVKKSNFVVEPVSFALPWPIARLRAAESARCGSDTVLMRCIVRCGLFWRLASLDRASVFVVRAFQFGLYVPCLLYEVSPIPVL